MRSQLVFVCLLLLASCGGSTSSSSQPADAANASQDGTPPGLGGRGTDAANDAVAPSEPDALADAITVPAADAAADVVSPLDTGVLEASVEAGDASEGSLEPNPSCSGIGATFVTGTETCWIDSEGSSSPVCVSNDYGYAYNPTGSVEPQIVMCFGALASGCPNAPDYTPSGPYFPKYAGHSLWCSAYLISRGPTVCTGIDPVPSGATIAYGLLDISDEDQDGVPDAYDNCVTVSNFWQIDTDQDGVGDACDNCPHAFNPDQQTGSTPGVGAACDCSASPQPALGPNGCPCPADGGFAVDIDGGSACGVVLDCTGHVVDAGVRSSSTLDVVSQDG